MRIRPVVLGLLAAALAGVSCEGQLPATSVRTLGRLHWLGKNGLAAQTNAAGLMTVWNLPQSAKIEAQTLDKLAAALSHSFATNRTQPLSAQLSTSLVRPLLEDLLNHESYVEVRQAGAQQCEWALAIRLDPRRAALWETNLQTSGLTARLSLRRAGDWTLLGPASNADPLLNEFLARIQRDHAPSQALPANDWIEAQFNPGRLAAALGLDLALPEGLEQAFLLVGGDGATVHERGQLSFAKPLDLKLEPWTLPTPLIAGQVTSFTAVRGIAPWLASLKAWSDLNVGSPPNQAYFWALQGPPGLSFWAAPHSEASNQVSRMADLLLQKCAPWFSTNPVAKLQKAKDYNGVEWKGIPVIHPFLKSVGLGKNSFVFGGLFPPPSGTNANRPLPRDLVKHLEGQEHLVAYSWELTALRTEAWLPIGQTLRLVAQKAQMPPGSASLAWLRAAGPKLWPSVTEVSQTGPGQLSFERRSNLGFTAVELHLMADWLESPEFPHGLHTLLASPSEASQAPAPASPPGGQRKQGTIKK
ncbi:MAG: hypothetical protein ACLQVX_02330 [Limisphaerales bacterium]